MPEDGKFDDLPEEEYPLHGMETREEFIKEIRDQTKNHPYSAKFGYHNMEEWIANCNEKFMHAAHPSTLARYKEEKLRQVIRKRVANEFGLNL